MNLSALCKICNGWVKLDSEDDKVKIKSNYYHRECAAKNFVMVENIPQNTRRQLEGSMRTLLNVGRLYAQQIKKITYLLTEPEFKTLLHHMQDTWSEVNKLNDIVAHWYIHIDKKD